MGRLNPTRLQHLWIWLNHACLNAGATLRCLFHMLKPPQFTHSPEAIELLAKTSPLRSFVMGLKGD